MITIEHIPQGLLVNNVFLFSDQKPVSIDWSSSDYIICSLECGGDVKYGAVERTYIDYPGEYQQDSMTIFCILSKDNKLNYVIKWLEYNFALVQDAKAVNAHAFEDVTDVIALGEWISLQLQKLDLQCTIVTG